MHTVLRESAVAPRSLPRTAAAHADAIGTGYRADTGFGPGTGTGAPTPGLTTLVCL